MANSNGTGFQNGSISFEEPRGVFYAGQVLHGKLNFQLKEPLEYSAINVLYHGFASVSWNETEIEEVFGQRRYKEVEYNGREDYFTVEQCVSGGPGGVFHLQAGTHAIPFQFEIPHNIPSTFEGERSDITYAIKAYLEFTNPSRLREELETEFEVIAPMDLNRYGSEVKQPLEFEFEEVYSCCLCGSDPVTIRIRLPASGFCPGQRIPINVEVANDTNVEVTRIIFSILSRECYRTTHPPSVYEPPAEEIAVVKKGPVMSKTKRHFICDLAVPDFIAPNLDNCGIIDVKYFIKVVIKLSGCNDDLEDESEIKIGLVPLESTLGGPYKHPMADSLPVADIPTLVVPVQQARRTHHQPNNAAHQTTAYPQNAGYPQPQQNSGYPQPPQNTGYPQQPGPQNSGYPPNNAPLNNQYPPPYTPQNNAPYPPSPNNPGYPPNNVPYTRNIGFAAGSPYPSAMPIPNVGANPPYPTNVGSNPPYPTSVGANPPYPMGNVGPNVSKPSAPPL